MAPSTISCGNWSQVDTHFLGYHLAPGRLTLAQATVERFVARAHRLYEQERGKPEGFPRLGAYVRRWERWTRAGGVQPILAALPQGGGG
jgi:hypothetical protein